MAAIRTAKKQLRASIREALSKVSQEAILEQSRIATASLLSTPQYNAATHVGVYLSMPQGEIVTSDIVRDALAKEKTVYVPYLHDRPTAKTELPRKLMDMVSLHSAEDYQECDNNRDSWGIPSLKQSTVSGRQWILGDMAGERRDENDEDETKPSRGPHSARVLDLVVVPGMAFDPKLGRLGHGKGFYDLFFQRYHEEMRRAVEEDAKMPFLVGLALKEQIVSPTETVPTEASDWRLDAVLIGDGTVICP